MKILLISAICLVVVGCTTSKEVIVVNKNIKVDIPEQYYNCPQLKFYPSVNTLTDVEVAKLIVALDSANKKCKASINAIRNYVKQYNSIVAK